MTTTTRVLLYFKCRGLADTDTFSKSDPYLVLYRVGSSGPVEVGRTEIVNNNLNPEFRKNIDVDYFFEEQQRFLVRIYDDDGHKKDADNDFLGEVPFLLAHVMGSRGHTKDFPIPAPGRGTLTVSAVDHGRTGNDTVLLQFYGRSMRKMDTFSDSDPYFKLSRVLANGQRTLLYQSEVIDDTLSPDWKALPVLRMSQLMGSKSDEKTLLFECFDDDMFGFKSMGQTALLSVDDLLAASLDQNKGFELRKEHKKENLYGIIHVRRCDIVRKTSFTDLLKMGWQINMVTAVDFTASNGDPAQPSSLHYFGSETAGGNEYQRALTAVGSVVLDYDSDKMVAAYGFGGVLPDGKVSHCFHLNLEPNPYVPGLPGLLDAYRRSLSAVRLSGPTNFAPILNMVVNGSREAERDRIYTILLMITDGEISDIDDTIDAIVRADDAALSVIIVGVGRGCDFVAMNQLDGDNQVLQSNGRKSRRDLVQFVAMRDFQGRSPAELAAEVLREVPAQVERWADLRDIQKPATL